MTTVLEEIQQETKQVPKQEYLNIDQIIPKWSRLLDMLNEEDPDRLEIRKFKIKHKLDIGEHARCIAGEANLFSDDYMKDDLPKFCDVCDRYADSHFLDLYDDIKTHGDYIGRDWRKSLTVRNFVRHWNNEHKEVTNVKR